MRSPYHGGPNDKLRGGGVGRSVNGSHRVPLNGFGALGLMLGRFRVG